VPTVVASLVEPFRDRRGLQLPHPAARREGASLNSQRAAPW